jgi:hypothetical protein
VRSAQVAQLPAGELAKIGQGLLQPFVVEIVVENDEMHVGRHDNVRIYGKVFLPMAEAQTFGHDPTALFVDENRQPIHDRVGQEVDGGFRVHAVTFHNEHLDGQRDLWDSTTVCGGSQRRA